MTQLPQPLDDDATRRAAELLGQGLNELLRAVARQSSLADMRQDIAAIRASLEALTARFERQTSEDREQRRLLGEQLAALSTSLDRLVTHLQGLSTLMAELLERLSLPASRTLAIATEEQFLPGSEGTTVSFEGVPGFQSLMDIQKTLAALPAVAAASVERYQEGDSRILLDLRAPVTASSLVEAIREGTGLNASVDEARPETRRLKLKIIS